MTYPIYRQDFEGGTTLATACPELVDLAAAYSIDSSGTKALTGTHALSCSGVNSTIYSTDNDTLSGDLTFSVYTRNASGGGFVSTRLRIRPAGQISAVTWIRLLFNAAGISIIQDNAGTQTTLNTPISGSSLPTGVYLCVELRCNGTAISARIVRQDTGQFFVNTGSGSWSSTPQVQSGTATVTGAGGFGFIGGDASSLYIDDWIIGPAVPSIDNPTFTLTNIGTTQQLTAGGFTDPLFGVTWGSSNTGVATVNSAGLVTAVAIGTATITATGKRDTGQTATAVATVTTSPATLYTVTPPSPASGYNHNLSGTYTIHLNGLYTGTITATPTVGFSLSPIVKTYSASSADQTFTFTPTATGVITWTFTNSGTLTNPGTTTYTSIAQTMAIAPLSVGVSSATTFTATGGGTLWQTGGVPTLPVSGLAGFTVSSIVVTSNTALTFTGTAPATTGTATVTDDTTGATVAIVVAATYSYLSVVGGLALGQTAGYTLYSPGSATPYQARSRNGVIELGNGIYQAYVALPVNSPMTFVWDDTQGRFMPDSVCPVLPTPPADWLSSAAVSAAAVAKLQSGLSTYAGGDTSGTTTLLGRLTSGRAGNLDNLDTAISTRSTYAGGDTTGTTTLLTRVGRTMWIDTAGRVAASIPGI